MASRRVDDDSEIVSILHVSHESSSDFCSSDSDCEISNANASETKSGTSDCVSVTGATEVSDWLQVTNSDPGPSTAFPVQNIEHKAVVPSSFDWTTEPVQYFELFFDLDLLGLILQENTLHGNKRKMQNMPPTKRARITDWSPPTLADIKALLGVVINIGLHPMSDITDYFSQAWVNKMPFFSEVFPRDEFLLLF
jgi:hypothetical protein